jgi:hypothetical protein
MPGPSAGSKSISGFDPRSIGGCQLWLDAADSNATGTSTNGAIITTWKDKSINGLTGTSSGSPTLVTLSQNGLPCVSFTAASSQYFNFGTGIPLLSSGITVFAVGKTTFGASGQTIVAKSRANGYNGRWALLYESPNLEFLIDVTIGGNVVAASSATKYSGVFSLFEGAWSSPTTFLYVNGNQTALANNAGTPLSTTDVLLVGAYPSSTGTVPPYGFYYNGTIGEIIVYNCILTSSQRQSVEGYLAWKWGIQASISSFSPTYISLCVLWLDAQDLTTMFTNTSGTTSVTAATQSVGLWKDKSGNGYNAIAVNASGSPTATFPTYQTTTGPAVYFANTADMMFFSNFFTGTSGYDIFVVGQPLPSTAPNYRTLLRGSSAEHPIIMNSGGIQIGAYLNTGGFNQFGGASGLTWTNSQTQLLFVTISSTNIYNAALNGNSSLSATANAGANNNFAYLGNYQGGAQPWGYVNELIILSNVSTTQRALIETYLSRKWGLTVSTTVTNVHPYTSIKPFTRQFSPLDIPGCALWLDAADASTTGTASTISSWNDKSGNGYNATAFGSPALTSNAINGNTAITLNGSSTYLTYTNATAMNTGSVITTFVVATVSGTIANYARLLSFGDPDYAAVANCVAWEVNGSSTLFELERNAQFVTSAGWTVNTPFIGCSQVIDSSITAYLNGTNILTATAGSYGNFGYSVYNIGRYSGGGYNWLGYICEVITYNTALTISQRQAVEGYLAKKWKVSISSHPFSNFPPSSPTIFSPTNFIGCKLWLDSSDFASLVLSTSSVTQWNDKSGNGYNAVLSTNCNATSPTYNTSTKAIQFVAANTNIGATSAGTALTIAQGFGNELIGKTCSFFFVAQRTVATGGAFAFFIAGQTTTANQNLLVGITNTDTMEINEYGAYLDTAITAYSAPDPVRIYGYAMNSINYTNILNGTVLNTALTGGTYSLLTAFIQPEIGRRYGNTSANVYHTFNLFEVIVFVPALTTTQRQQVEGYLAAKWNIQKSLPTTHPYYKYTPSQLSLTRLVANVSISLATTTLTATWSYNPDVTSYTFSLFQSTSSPPTIYGTIGGYATITGITSNSYTYTGLQVGYFYRASVTAIGPGGSSQSSASSSIIYLTTPSAPTLVITTTTGATTTYSYTLSWSGLITACTNTNWYIGTSTTYNVNNVFSGNTTNSSGAGSVSGTGLSPNTLYYAFVQGYNISSGTTSSMSSASAGTWCLAVPTFNSPSFTPSGTNTQLNWTNNATAGATNIYVYLGTSSYTSYPLNNTALTSYSGSAGVSFSVGSTFSYIYNTVYSFYLQTIGTNTSATSKIFTFAYYNTVAKRTLSISPGYNVTASFSGAGGGGGYGTDGAGSILNGGFPGVGAVISNVTFSVNTGSTLNIYVGQAGSNVYGSASGSITTNAVCGDGSIGGYGGYAYYVGGIYGANGGGAGGGGAATALICSGVAVIVCGGGGGGGNGGGQGGQGGNGGTTANGGVGLDGYSYNGTLINFGHNGGYGGGQGCSIANRNAGWIDGADPKNSLVAYAPSLNQLGWRGTAAYITSITFGADGTSSTGTLTATTAIGNGGSSGQFYGQAGGGGGGGYSGGGGGLSCNQGATHNSGGGGGGSSYSSAGGTFVPASISSAGWAFIGYG